MTREGGEPNLAEQKYQLDTHTDDRSRAVHNVTNTNTVATVVIDGVFLHICGYNVLGQGQAISQRLLGHDGQIVET